MLGNPLLLGDDGYQISRSVRLRSAASGYLNRTPASAGNRQIFTWSGWVKRSKFGSRQSIFDSLNTATQSDSWEFNASDKINISSYNAAYVWQLITTPVYRDPSGWYHIVIAVDTTQATASNRVKLYVNGSQVTAFDTATYPTLNYLGYMNLAAPHYIGTLDGTQLFHDGYITEVNFIDGQALTPSSFGQNDPVTGVWQPKKYTGTYGTNGFYLNFSDNSAATAAAIGKDSSGNGNNWTPNNISVTAGATYDSMLDVPTPWADGGNGRGNYCVLNPLSSHTVYTETNGNLDYAGSQSASYTTFLRSTIAVSSGKFYWEILGTNTSSSASSNVFGIQSSAVTVISSATVFDLVDGVGYRKDGFKLINATATAYGAAYTDNDVIGVALDMTAGTIEFFKNGASQGVAATGLTGTYGPVIAVATTGTARAVAGSINFGQRPFTYTPPTGFKALNTLNLPEPTIKAGNKYFDATLYTGNGATQNIVNAGGFQPDLVWLKGRSAATGNALYDAVRGVLNYLGSESTAGESTIAGTVTAFNFNGFSIGNQAGTNSNAATYVGWQWKEGATQGFDIVTYTGTGVARTLAHTLGVAPSMMIVKQRSAGASDWAVYHSSMLATRRLSLNTTGAQNTTSAAWNNTAPTSSEFTVGTGGDVNANGNTYVAYLFAEVSGFSKFGSYTGNGSADGPFVFCGFRPKWVMFKNINTGTTNWSISDTARSPDNVSDEYLLANTSGAEVSSVTVDLLSNGFKLRNTGTWYNTNGDTYIFAAFAENPFKYSLAR